jgi:hypothetical protein
MPKGRIGDPAFMNAKVTPAAKRRAAKANGARKATKAKLGSRATELIARFPRLAKHLK